jgi:hypothetical protein
MKKNPQEIVSLNDELISFDSSDIGIEALEQRLELILVHNFSCLTFACKDFGPCVGFTCGSFFAS